MKLSWEWIKCFFDQHAWSEWEEVLYSEGPEGHKTNSPTPFQYRECRRKFCNRIHFREDETKVENARAWISPRDAYAWIEAQPKPNEDKPQ